MSGWDYYAVCPEGHVVDRVAFGSMFHVHARLCPECAAPKDSFEMVVGRWVRNGWFSRRFEQKDAARNLEGER
jgi:hypothetical protein